MEKILLVWQYYRPDFIETFKNISHDYEFIFLAEIFPKTSTDFVRDFASIIYWKDFPHAQAILENIKPDKVIFMGLEGLISITLNAKAKEKKIPTYYLQHGLYSSIDNYIDLQKTNIQLNKKENSYKTFIFQFIFYVKTFSFNIKSYHYLIKYTINKFSKKTQIEFLINNPIENRKANYYIAYTKQNLESIAIRDKIPEDIIIPIGIPKLDKYFKEYDIERNVTENYVLLIDTPLVEINNPNGSVEKKNISAEIANTFYRQLNNFAKKNNLKLKIKLHPYNYASTFYLKDNNITYLKDCDIDNEILKSKYIVSFYSTLMLQIVLTKPFLIIKYDTKTLISEIEETLSIQFPKITDTNIDFKFFHLSNYPSLKEELIRKYVYKTDGNATIRLKELFSQKF